MRALALAALALLLAHAAAAKPLRKPKRGIQVRAGEFTVQPGQDLEVCEYRRLPNRKPIDVSRIVLRMPKDAHHFALWGYGGQIRDDAAFPAGPVENVGCTGVAPDDFFPQLLVPTQSPNTELRFPKGVGLRLEPRQQVWLNSHMKNFGATPMQPDVRINFYRAKGKIRHYAEAITFGNMSEIRIPAGGEQTLTAEWGAPFDLTLIHLSTHQHRLGTYADIEIVSPDGATREKVVESPDWEHPNGVWFRAGRRLAKGQKLRITCRWHNTEPHEVRFGPETTDEMCFGLGFFYREAEAASTTGELAAAGCLPGRKGLICPFAPAVAP